MKSTKEKILLNIIQNDILWMAIRYAHGRHTYAPSIIRNVVGKLKEMYPDFNLKNDKTIHPPEEISGTGIRSDWLDNLFENKNETN